MTNKRRSLMLLSASVLCLCAIAPAEVADGRLPRWTNILWDLRQGAEQAAGLTRTLAANLHWPRLELTQPPEGPVKTAEKAEATPAGPATSAPFPGETSAAASIAERMRDLGIDPTGIQEALDFYRAGNLEAGDGTARNIANPIVRTALEWMALHDEPEKAGLKRLNAFMSAHPDWPARNWLRTQVEASLFRTQDVAAIRAAFAGALPHTPTGKLALARALRAQGQNGEATQTVRALYRDADLTPFLEGRIRADFGGDLQKSDYKYRADRLLYKEDTSAALRTAAFAGPDVLALERARAAVTPGATSDKAIAASDKAFAAVPPDLRGDPGLLLAQIQKLRHADKPREAASLMLAAPRDPSLLIDPDEWWTERRVLARKMLDIGDTQTAYQICAGHSASSPEARVEAEFHAGWIALRFLNRPAAAAQHFGAAARIATTPASIARVAYWQGRAAENTLGKDALVQAKSFYEKAAAYPSTYYGQAARAALGLKSSPMRMATGAATGASRAEATSVIEILFAAGEKDAATQLAADAARTLTDETQIAALANVIKRQRDAHLSLITGKLMSQRGFAVDDLAFPTFGIPRFEPLGNSAPVSVVYSVAMQESAFNPAAQSSAGAKGLMQMIDSTARQTAAKAGLPFNESRLLSDAAFNAQLGAAHLGALLAGQGGSYILTFAAYNAGGGHVRDWIAAYGDPRDPGVDPIDWVERIPFTETRNYVQRVMANVTMYRARFAEDEPVPNGTTDPKKLAQAKF
jgi:soluble lytic murein transglycosylase